MNILLIYYSGTNNTTYLTEKLKDRFLSSSNSVTTYRVNPLKLEKLDMSNYDLIGIGYPIYGFNIPGILHKFLKLQTFPKDRRIFIYKNSGETYRYNDASSLIIRKMAKRAKANLTNEYHFLMPYNIHFRFDELLVKEMLEMDDLLLDILEKEIESNISNIKPYKFLDRLTNYLFRLTYIGGKINVLFYKVDKSVCVKCRKCIDSCQTKNIYLGKKGNIKFKSNCLMCMSCTLNCPKDCIRMGLFNSWRVNRPYDFSKIRLLDLKEPYIKETTTGFFKCYVKTYKDIKRRHIELFNE